MKKIETNDLLQIIGMLGHIYNEFITKEGTQWN
jgi:hypothetical protein